MLEINDLKVSYGVIPALKGISFKVDEGEIVALIGANGAGKTTALHTISGLIKPVSGTITFCGEEITDKPAYKIVEMGISHVPEGRGIFPELTVSENLGLGAYLRSDKEEIRKDLEGVYRVFPVLKERLQQSAGTLSGGEQQMLAIGRALMARPKLLLLDEPSMGLAPLVVEEIFRTIKRINKKDSTTILLVEQNAQMALAVSHKAYVLETGEIAVSGTSGELKENDTVRQAYLGV